MENCYKIKIRRGSRFRTFTIQGDKVPAVGTVVRVHGEDPRITYTVSKVAPTEPLYLVRVV